MPFKCEFKLDKGILDKSDEVKFVEFIESSFGKYFKEPVKIAKVIYNGSEAYIYTNCPCMPLDKGNLQPGQQINANTILGYFGADGEEIPYHKPSATIKIS